MFTAAKNETLNILVERMSRHEVNLNIDLLRIYPKDESSEIDVQSRLKSNIKDDLIAVIESLPKSARILY